MISVVVGKHYYTFTNDHLLMFVSINNEESIGGGRYQNQVQLTKQYFFYKNLNPMEHSEIRWG